ncbi:MAG: siroheme synthase CysG [Gammaproteobacteria bacterium]|nr:siroheme synthase CysG [Gammaproteobacteria bacterium]
MEFLPIFLDLKQRPCVVVGGGDIAFRKIKLLLRAGAKVTVIAPEVCQGLNALKDEVTCKVKNFEPSDLQGCDLVIAATNDRTVNSQISAAARERGMPVNVVDQPDLCSFIVPSIIDRSPVVVAVSSSGSSPVLARLLRARLETMIPSSYGRLAELVRGFRDQVRDKLKVSRDIRIFWEKILQGPVAEMMFAGQEDAAKAALQQAINTGDTLVDKSGEVYLVGAGPGDPDLLTFRALRLLQQADVVVYDRLVSKEILDLVRKDAEFLYVGKQRDDHALPQNEINEVLVRFAKQGKRVLRLKGGDPFIFGRGGEEIEELAAAGVPFQIVPGITAASGTASYAGIPLTHRDYAQSLVFVTGHLKDGSQNLNWTVLAQPHQTVVVYMGLVGVKNFCKQLLAHGAPKDRPMALVQKATTRDQKVIVGTVETIPDLVEKADIKPPTLIIIGDVVNLQDKLAWFDPRDNT